MALPKNKGQREFDKFVESAAGDVAIRTVAVSASGADAVQTEDTAHTTGDAGSQMLAVRNDSLASLSGTDGDYSPLQVSATGELFVGGGAAHDAATLGNPQMGALEAKAFDGSALPNVVNAEGDVVRTAGSLSGVGYMMLTDEDGSDTPMVAESAVIAAAAGGTVGLMTMGEARDSQKTEVTEADAVRPSLSLSGETIQRSHTYATKSDRAEEIDPLDQKYVSATLATVTNETSATTYYYVDMAGFKSLSVQADTGGTAPTDTLTITFEGSNQDDGTAAASVFYTDITKLAYDAATNAVGTASWVDVDMMAFFTPAIAAEFKFIRVKTVTAGGSNDQDYTIFSKKSY